MGGNDFGDDIESTYPGDDEDEGAALATPIATNLGPGVHDISLLDYLADPCITPSLRSSDIQRMLRFTPAHVKALHPRLCEPSQREWAIRKATKRMDLGSVIHALVLGNGSKFCVLDPSDFLTKKGEPAKAPTAEYKAAVADALSRGLLVLGKKGNDAAARAADRLRAKLAEEFADLGGWPFGEVERTLIWTEQTKFGPVMCRTRPDILNVLHGIVGDVKSSAAGLSDDDVQRSMSASKGEMFIQAAWQRRGVLANYPELGDALRHVHPFIETEPPFEPRVIWSSVDTLLTADMRCMRAAEQFALCMARSEWWGWPPATIAAAPYLGAKWAEEENAWADEALAPEGA